MALAAVSVNESHHRLMMAIGDAIAAHTRETPMAIDEIVGVLGFCAGSAIISGCRASSNQRRMREVAIGNIDVGMDVMRRATSNLIVVP